MSNPVHVRSPFQSTYPDGPDLTKFQPSHQNADRLFTGGTNGDVVTRDTSSPTGASWAPASGGGGAYSIVYVSRTLTHAEILALPTTPVTLVDPPPAGHFLEFLVARLISSFAVGYAPTTSAERFVNVTRLNDFWSDVSAILSDAPAHGISRLTAFLANTSGLECTLGPGATFLTLDAGAQVMGDSAQDPGVRTAGFQLSWAGEATVLTGGDPANTLTVAVLGVTGLI